MRPQKKYDLVGEVVPSEIETRKKTTELNRKVLLRTKHRDRNTRIKNTKTPIVRCERLTILRKRVMLYRQDKK